MADPRIRVKQELDNSQFKKGLRDSKGQVNAFSSSLKQIGGMVAGAFAVGAVVNFTKESINLAAQVEGVANAFNRLSNSRQLLRDLQKATHNTVTELDLMKAAVQWNNFKLPLEKLPIALEFAHRRANETGESVEFLVDSMVRGLGRRSVLILDNLGLSVTEINEEVAKTGDFFEGAFTIMQREMDKAGEYTETTKDSIAGAARAIDEMKVSWGNMVNSVLNSGLLKFFTDTFDYLSWGLDKVKKSGGKFKDWWHWFWQTGEYQTDEFLRDKYVEENPEAYDKLRNVLTGNLPAGGGSYGDIAGHGQGLEVIKKTYKEISDEIKLYEEKLRESINTNDGHAESLAKTILKLEKQKQAIEDQFDALLGRSKAMEEERKKLEELTEAQQKYNDEIRHGLDQFATEANLQGLGEVDDLPTSPEGVMSGDDIMPDEQSWEDNMKAAEEWVSAWEENAQRIQNAMDQMAGAFADALGAFIKGEAKFGDVVKGLLTSIIKIVAGYLAESVAASFAGGASVGGPAAPITGAAMAGMAVSLFGALVPAVMMARGGIVPQGFPNDTYHAMLSSGETVLPKPIPLAGANMMGELSAKIRGEDLYIILNKTTSKHNRYS